MPEYLPVLVQFLQKFPKNIPLAVEIRHERWFSEAEHFNRLFDLLEEHNIATVITDVSGRRDVLHQRLTSGTVLIRFVGNGLIPTDYTRVDAWLQRIKYWLEAGLEEVYFFTHEPSNILGPQLADYVVKEFKKLCPTIPTRGPNLDLNKPKQISLF